MTIDNEDQAALFLLKLKEWAQGTPLRFRPLLSLDRPASGPAKVMRLARRYEMERALPHRLWGACGVRPKRPTATATGRLRGLASPSVIERNTGQARTRRSAWITTWNGAADPSRQTVPLKRPSPTTQTAAMARKLAGELRKNNAPQTSKPAKPDPRLDHLQRHHEQRITRKT